MKYTWDLIYIVVGMIAICIAIIVPSLASWAGLGGIGILLFGLYETFKDYKNTNSDLVDYDYTITDCKTDNPTKNDFNDDDSTEDEYYKYKYHVTKYQFRIIVGILVIGILVISVLSTLLALVIVILVFIIIKLHNSK